MHVYCILSFIQINPVDKLAYRFYAITAYLPFLLTANYVFFSGSEFHRWWCAADRRSSDNQTSQAQKRYTDRVYSPYIAVQ